jgi:hypothetical protein
LNVSARQIGALRTTVSELLRADDFTAHLAEWAIFSPRQVISPLLSFLFSTDEKVKWRTVTAVGIVVAEMAHQDLEAARTIMRRLMWSLNDESGGIGWGAPEALGEIMARHRQLAEEYHHILLSYIRDDGNRLEHDVLECGVLWGLGRLAQERPHLLKGSLCHFIPYLRSQNPTQRGLATWALGFLSAVLPFDALAHLLKDHTEMVIYEKGSQRRHFLSELAAKLLQPFILNVSL